MMISKRHLSLLAISLISAPVTLVIWQGGSTDGCRKEKDLCNGVGETPVPLVIDAAEPVFPLIQAKGISRSLVRMEYPSSDITSDQSSELPTEISSTPWNVSEKKNSRLGESRERYLPEDNQNTPPKINSKLGVAIQEKNFEEEETPPLLEEIPETLPLESSEEGPLLDPPAQSQIFSGNSPEAFSENSTTIANPLDSVPFQFSDMKTHDEESFGGGELPLSKEEKNSEMNGNPEWEAVTSRARGHVQRGTELASRGAIFSARAEFLQALSVLAQALDARDGNQRHSQALRQGLTALKEAEDFSPRDSAQLGERNVAQIVVGHFTPVLRETMGLEEMPPLVAVQRYLTYSEQQLGIVAESQPVGSLALNGLGKLQSHLAGKSKSAEAMGEFKAVVFHQAALLTDSNNYIAANDLAILLFRQGRLEPARDLFRHALSLKARPEFWHNLAQVHYRLGEQSLAIMAEKEMYAARESRGKSLADGTLLEGPVVRWLDEKTFAQTTIPSSDLQNNSNTYSSSAENPLREVHKDNRQTRSPSPSVEEPRSLSPFARWKKSLGSGKETR